MACEKCGSPEWSDDDLRWHWCTNPKCFNSFFANNERTRDYEKEIAYRERLKVELSKE